MLLPVYVLNNIQMYGRPYSTTPLEMCQVFTYEHLNALRISLFLNANGLLLILLTDKSQI